MAIAKQAGMNWKSYLRALADSNCNISDLEKVELAGYLLRDENIDTSGSTETLMPIFEDDQGGVADAIATFLIAESPETTEDLLDAIRSQVMNYYSHRIDVLIAEEIEDLKEERREAKQRQNPNDEYDPDMESKL